MVVYELTGKDGSRGECSGACFGGLNSRYATADSRKKNSKKFVNSRHVDPRKDMTNLLYFSFIPERSIHTGSWAPGDHPDVKVAMDNYFKAAVELANDLKNHSDILRVNQLTKKIDVFIRNETRDKIMATMFIFRNLSNYRSVAVTYQKVRRMGYKPLFSYLMAEIFYEVIGAFGAGSVSVNGMNENTIINNSTFGLNSFLSFLRQDGFDFFGERWVDKPGYSRDGDFNSQGIRFNGRFGRRLPDVMSIEGDEPLPYQIKFAPNSLLDQREENWSQHAGTTMDAETTSASYFFSYNFGRKSLEEWVEILSGIANEHGITVRE